MSRVTCDLGINETPYTVGSSSSVKNQTPSFPRSGKLSTEDEQFRKLEREKRDLRAKNEISKKDGFPLR